jgi:outer membrane protein TolC
MRKKLILAITLFIAIPIFSLRLDVEKCKQLAVKNSEEIKIAEKQKSVADYKKMQYRSNFFPKISFNATYLYKNDPLEYSIEEAYLPTYLYTENGITPNLLIDPSTNAPVIGPDGNPIFNEYAFFPGVDLSLSMQNAYLASIRAKQPIFMGGKIFNGYKMSKIGAKAASVNYDREKENLLIETELAYWRLVSLRQKVILAEQYEELVTQVVKQLSDAVEVGMIQQNNLLKAKVKLNDAKLKKQKAQHGDQLAKLALERVLGIELKENVVLVDSIIEIQKNNDLEINEEMFIDRKDYKLLHAKYDIAKKKKSIAFAEFLPEIGVQASYSELRYELNDNERKSDDTTIMASCSLPIFQWGETYAKNKQADLNREKARLELEKGIELMKLEIKKNEFALSDAILRYEMANIAVEQAQENLRVANDNFDLKRSTLTDILEAQTEWQKAKSEKIESEIDYKKAHLNLLRSVGKLF